MSAVFRLRKFFSACMRGVCSDMRYAIFGTHDVVCLIWTILCVVLGFRAGLVFVLSCSLRGRASCNIGLNTSLMWSNHQSVSQSLLFLLYLRCRVPVAAKSSSCGGIFSG